MLTFEKASTMIRRGDSKRLSGVATYLYKRNDDTYAVRYHNTDVVLIHRDGTYTLNSGGWHTSTTKARINEYSPARLYQSKHEWYIEGKRPFTDGVRIDSQGRVVSASGDPISEVEANPFHPDHKAVVGV